MPHISLVWKERKRQETKKNYRKEGGLLSLLLTRYLVLATITTCTYCWQVTAIR